MFMRPTAHQRLCVDCHGIEGLWRFLYYHKDRRNPYHESKINPSFVNDQNEKSARDAGKHTPKPVEMTPSLPFSPSGEGP
jgi:hypothetical protein